MRLQGIEYQQRSLLKMTDCIEILISGTKKELQLIEIMAMPWKEMIGGLLMMRKPGIVMKYTGCEPKGWQFHIVKLRLKEHG
jgi:hypothetical protein